MRKDMLLKAIAELVENLKELGMDEIALIHLLLYYGFTREQLADWYALGGNSNE